MDTDDDPTSQVVADQRSVSRWKISSRFAIASGLSSVRPSSSARPMSRSMQTSSGTWRSSTTSSGRSSSSSRSSSASAWAAFRGKPSSTNPFSASSSESRSRMRPIVKLVRHEGPGREDRLDLEAERRPCGDRGAEHLPRRDVRNAVLLGDARSLRALAGALRAQNQHVQRQRATSGSLRRSASSSATPSGASCRARHRP